jgi:hypothetical protein
MNTTHTPHDWLIALGKRIANVSESELIDWSARISTNNPWFTIESIKYSLDAWATMLSETEVNFWLSHYQLDKAIEPKKIGVVMAGNIPFAGLHDFLVVLLCGHHLKAKRSSQDLFFPQWILSMLQEIAPEVASRVEWVDKIEHIDAVIATGSGNTSRYFEFYFAKWPRIIRKNRTSVAVLKGNETDEQLRELAKDVFVYYGLGCRNVSKVFIPEGHSLNDILRVFEEYQWVKNLNKYGNNYDYNRSVYYMNLIPFYENDVLLMKEDQALSSPIAVLFFEYYQNVAQVQMLIEAHREEIQCVVAAPDLIDGSLNFGEAQHPQLMDYADGVDTMAFLLNL